MRKLIWVPVIHNYADMGISSEKALNPKYEHYEFEMRVECFWDLVGRELAEMEINHSKLQIYMDSWHEALTVHDALIAASSGSRNFKLIIRYMKRGAILMRTEIFDHLTVPAAFYDAIRRRSWEPEWFNRLRRIIVFEYYFWTGRFEPRNVVFENLDIRDRYVADRIQKTLAADGTAILFMGALHNPLKYITDPDIEIVHLPKVTDEAYKIAQSLNIRLTP